MKTKYEQRNQSGLSVTFLLCFITFFVIGPLSMFVYELSRYNLAAQQLKYCADAAALTAATSTTASGAGDPTAALTLAMSQATAMFCQNTILDQPLTGTPSSYGTGAIAMTPAVNKAQLYYQFLDPVTKVPQPITSSNGKILQITAAWGYQPITSNFTHIAPGPYVITQTSDGGLPELDIVLCFDVSASMDDFTNVTLVNRWTPTGGNTQYAMATPNSTYLSGNYAQGPLYYAVGCYGPTGSGLNATWPMEYDEGGSGDSNTFSIYGGGLTSGTGLHGTHHGAIAPITSAPGNYLYTDMVVNVDGTTNFTSGATVSVGGSSFYFPPADSSNLPYGILVEAARGNLEDAGTAASAGINTTSTTAGFKKYSGFSFRTGWFQAYYTLCMQLPSYTASPAVTPVRRPIGDAILAAQNFFSTLNNDADVHFGIVTFGDTPSASSNYGTTDPTAPSPLSNSGAIVPAGYPNATQIYVPYPVIGLVSTPGPSYSNYDTSATPARTSVNGCLYNVGLNTTPWNYGISSLLAYGGTDIADALDVALAMQLGTYSTDPSSLHNGRLAGARVGATRAIVLFTDGLPNGGGDSYSSSSGSFTWTASQNEANLANQAGIPIYTIGLALVSSLQADQTQVLGSSATTSPQGIAYLSGHGATFSQTTSTTQLNAIFQNLARQLVQLVRTSN